MIGALQKENINGKAKTVDRGMVERGREESAGVCKSEAVAAAGCEEAGAYAGSSLAEGDEARDSISIDPEEGGVEVDAA